MAKNLAKLVKKVITNKNGKKTTVWVKMGEAQSQPKKEKKDGFDVNKPKFAGKDGPQYFTIRKEAKELADFYGGKIERDPWGMYKVSVDGKYLAFGMKKEFQEAVKEGKIVIKKKERVVKERNTSTKKENRVADPLSTEEIVGRESKLTSFERKLGNHWLGGASTAATEYEDDRKLTKKPLASHSINFVDTENDESKTISYDLYEDDKGKFIIVSEEGSGGMGGQSGAELIITKK